MNDARRVFPCFDEPAFKAIWHVSVSGVPTDAVALSNGVATRDGPGPGMNYPRV